MTDSGIIDAQVHIWDWNSLQNRDPVVSREDLQRSFLPNDLSDCLADCDVAQGLMVEAEKSSYSLSIWWLEVTEYCPFLKNTVLGCDLEADNLGIWLEAFTQWQGFRGMRAAPDLTASWKEHPGLNRSLGLLSQYGLTVDLELEAHHLPHLAELAQHYGNIRFVLNHAAGAPGPGGDFADWVKQVATLKEAGNVWVKTTDRSLGDSADRRSAVLGTLLDTLGPDRIIWGSGWPLLRPEVSYREALEDVKTLTGELSAEHRNAIFGQNLARAYRI